MVCAHDRFNENTRRVYERNVRIKLLKDIFKKSRAISMNQVAVTPEEFADSFNERGYEYEVTANDVKYCAEVLGLNVRFDNENDMFWLGREFLVDEAELPYICKELMQEYAMRAENAV